MKFQDKILDFLKSHLTITAQDLVKRYGVSRQFASREINVLVKREKLGKQGSTRAARYFDPQRPPAERSFSKKLLNKNLQEHVVIDDLEAATRIMRSLPENVRSIFYYAFSEMLNNAIEHSKSRDVHLHVHQSSDELSFIVRDFGIGVFRNIMHKRHLKTEYEAIQDLLKGKVTTAPRAHSGEGIFFTSKISDRFVLESFGLRLTIDNQVPDVFIEEPPSSLKGTQVEFSIQSHSKKHLNDVFLHYQSDPATHAFDKTEVKVKLFTFGTIHISRSQAKRVLSGLEKFHSVILDFDQVPMIGQAFADEIFRVFKVRHPDIQMTPINMNDAVRFMIERVEKV